MKNTTKKRYTVRLTEDVAAFVETVSKRRGISAAALIKWIIGEYKEVNGYGKHEDDR